MAGAVRLVSLVAFTMTQKRVFKSGDVVSCRCPDGICKLPNGLPKNAMVEVVSTYLSRTYVRYYDKTFLVRNDCLHKERNVITPAERFSLGD